MTIRVALLGDGELVWRGLESMLASVSDEYELVSPKDRDKEPIDVALVDTFGAASDGTNTLQRALADPYIRNVAVYTWNHHPGLADRIVAGRVTGYLSKSLTAEELSIALHDIHAGGTVVAPRSRQLRGDLRHLECQRLTPREQQTVFLIGTGLSNDEVAAALGLTANSIKSYIRSAYRKIGAQSRSQAILWSLTQGLRMPDADEARGAAVVRPPSELAPLPAERSDSAPGRRARRGA